MVFADASALIAIISREQDALALADCLQRDPLRLCSPLSVWETVAGLCRSYSFTVDAARGRVSLFIDALDLQLVPIGQHEYDLAIEAYAKFGKGRHPARLNMGDCYAYACAKAHHAALLFKGDDFGQTDIAVAMI